jgi:hypothetical protein
MIRHEDRDDCSENDRGHPGRGQRTREVRGRICGGRVRVVGDRYVMKSALLGQRSRGRCTVPGSGGRSIRRVLNRQVRREPENGLPVRGRRVTGWTSGGRGQAAEDRDVTKSAPRGRYPGVRCTEHGSRGRSIRRVSSREARGERVQGRRGRGRRVHGDKAAADRNSREHNRSE